MPRNDAEPSPNPITVEVARNAVNACADDMATALCKSAYNMMIYEVRKVSMCISLQCRWARPFR